MFQILVLLMGLDPNGLIDRLNHKDFQTRVEANQRLVRLGDEAIPVIEERLKTELDSERLVRLGEIHRQRFNQARCDLSGIWFLPAERRYVQKDDVVVDIAAKYYVAARIVHNDTHLDRPAYKDRWDNVDVGLLATEMYLMDLLRQGKDIEVAVTKEAMTSFEKEFEKYENVLSSCCYFTEESFGRLPPAVEARIEIRRERKRLIDIGDFDFLEDGGC